MPGKGRGSRQASRLSHFSLARHRDAGRMCRERPVCQNRDTARDDGQPLDGAPAARQVALFSLEHMACEPEITKAAGTPARRPPDPSQTLPGMSPQDSLDSESLVRDMVRLRPRCLLFHEIGSPVSASPCAPDSVKLQYDLPQRILLLPEYLKFAICRQCGCTLLDSAAPQTRQMHLGCDALCRAATIFVGVARLIPAVGRWPWRQGNQCAMDRSLANLRIPFPNPLRRAGRIQMAAIFKESLPLNQEATFRFSESPSQEALLQQGSA